MSTQQPTQGYQALYRACMKEAAGQGRGLMQRLIVRASESLTQRAVVAPDERERRLLRESAQTLLKHERTLGESFPQALLAEFAQAISGDARRAGALSFDALELMGDEQVRENVELMRLQQAVDSQVEAEIADLNALVSSVQGLKSVQPQRNPLRPEVYVRSLRASLQQSPVPHAVRARWMLSLGDALGPELARTYRELAAWLRAQGVLESAYVAVPSPETHTQGATALNIQELRHLLTGAYETTRADDRPAAPPPAEFSMTVPAAFDALKDMKQAGEVMKRVRQQGASGARATAQAIAQEVVIMMVDTIAGDSRLLPPVQSAVRGLAPALKRLALEDPRFFSDRAHPARRLLDEMTQRSLAWQSVDAPGFVPFMEPLQQAVEALRVTQVDGPGPFAFAMQTLEEAWGDAQARDTQHREKAVRALLRAEQHKLLAEREARTTRTPPESSLKHAPSEARGTGFDDTNQSLPPQALYRPTQPAAFDDTRPLSREEPFDFPVAQLQPGAWVEMMTGDGWGRYQVTWASPHGTLFMFTGASGQPQSMTSRLLGKMLQGGTLRLVSAQAVVDGALDAVAQAALRNSLGVKL